MWFHKEFGTLVGEMETASAAQVAALLHVPFLGIRVVSDNITNGGAYDPKTSEACEDYVYQVVKAYIATLKRWPVTTEGIATKLDRIFRLRENQTDVRTGALAGATTIFT